MEQPRDGGGTAARAASKTRRVTVNRKGLKIVAAQLDGHWFKMKGVSVSRKRSPDGGGTSIFTPNRA